MSPQFYCCWHDQGVSGGDDENQRPSSQRFSIPVILSLPPQLALLATLSASGLLLLLRRQALLDKSLQMINLQRIRRMHQAVVGLELQIPYPELRLEHLRRLDPPFIPDQWIGIAMTHEPLRFSVHVPVLLGQSLHLLAQDQVRRQTEDAGELVGCRRTREEGHGAALGEAAEDDSV
jgi:hypothetical protein